MRIVLSSCLVWWFFAGAGVAAGDQFSYDPQNQRDPFIPLVRQGKIESRQPVQATPVLTGILWDPDGNSIALINDSEVGVGDVVAGYQVVEIESAAVVLDRDGKHVVLEISGGKTTTEGTPSDVPAHQVTGNRADVKVTHCGTQGD